VGSVVGTGASADRLTAIEERLSLARKNIREGEEIVAGASARAIAVRAARDEADSAAEIARKRWAEASEEASVCAMAAEALRKLAADVASDSEKSVAGIATSAIRDAFPDQSLAVEVIHETFRGQPAARILLRDEAKGIQGDPLKSFGGGVCSLLGIVLQVVAILRHKGLRRILVLDEPMSDVSAEYEEAAAEVLRTICDPVDQGGLGFHALVVTHSSTFAQAAHRRYEASLDGDGWLRVESVSVEPRRRA
jgi:DNA repair exonuclease SbcCD ATPase subunit